MIPKKTITFTKVLLRGKKASSFVLGSTTSVLAGIEDLEVTLILQKQEQTYQLILYATKPGLHDMVVEEHKPFMLLMTDESVMTFQPSSASEQDISLLGASIKSKLLAYYSLSREQLKQLTQKQVSKYRLNTYGQHHFEDTVNPARSEQLRAAANCLLN